MGCGSNRPGACGLFFIGQNVVCRRQRTAFQALAALTQAIFRRTQKLGISQWSALLPTNLEEVSIHLDEVGLKYRTLIPQQEGVRVIICGRKGELADKIKQFIKLLTPVEETFVKGVFGYFGDEDRQKAAQIYRQIIQQFESRHMSVPEEEIPMFLRIGRKWYLQEKPEWDPKTKLAAAHMRHLYEWYFIKSPEEKAQIHERFRQLMEEAKARGAKVYMGDEEEEEEEASGTIFT